MLSGNELIAALRALSPQPAQGVAFRSVSEKVFNNAKSPLDYLLGGGRYNVPREYKQQWSAGLETFGLIYLADQPETASREVGEIVETRVGLIRVPGPRRIELSVKYELNAVLDLTNIDIQNALGTNLQELTGQWRTMNDQEQIAPTQVCGSAVRSLGSIEAAIVPCAPRPYFYNLVVFPDSLSINSFLEIYDNSDNFLARLPTP